METLNEKPKNEAIKLFEKRKKVISAHHDAIIESGEYEFRGIKKDGIESALIFTVLPAELQGDFNEFYAQKREDSFRYGWIPYLNTFIQMKRTLKGIDYKSVSNTLLEKIEEYEQKDRAQSVEANNKA